MAFKAAHLSPDRERWTELGIIVGFVDDSNEQATLEEPTAWLRLREPLSKCSCHVKTWKFTAFGSPVLGNDRDNYGKNQGPRCADRRRPRTSSIATCPRMRRIKHLLSIIKSPLVPNACNSRNYRARVRNKHPFCGLHISLGRNHGPSFLQCIFQVWAIDWQIPILLNTSSQQFNTRRCQ